MPSWLPQRRSPPHRRPGRSSQRAGGTASTERRSDPAAKPRAHGSHHRGEAPPALLRGRRSSHRRAKLKQRPCARLTDLATVNRRPGRSFGLASAARASPPPPRAPPAPQSACAPPSFRRPGRSLQLANVPPATLSAKAHSEANRAQRRSRRRPAYPPLATSARATLPLLARSRSSMLSVFGAECRRPARDLPAPSRGAGESRLGPPGEIEINNLVAISLGNLEQLERRGTLQLLQCVHPAVARRVHHSVARPSPVVSCRCWCRHPRGDRIEQPSPCPPPRDPSPVARRVHTAHPRPRRARSPSSLLGPAPPPSPTKRAMPDDSVGSQPPRAAARHPVRGHRGGDVAQRTVRARRRRPPAGSLCGAARRLSRR